MTVLGAEKSGQYPAWFHEFNGRYGIDCTLLALAPPKGSGNQQEEARTGAR